MTAQYTLYPDKKRVLLPSTIGVILLAGIFYGAALINLSLLDIEITPLLHLLIGGIMLLLVIVQFLLTLKKSKTAYVFEQDGVKHGKKKVPYARLGEVHIKQDPIDKIFDTGSVITDMMSFDHIANPQQLAQYVQQWEQYAQQYTQNYQRY